jgi:TatD DNase family protein
LNYIDIHTHTNYNDPETIRLLNVFPNEPDKMNLPVYLSVGLHPWHILTETLHDQLDMVNRAASHSRVIAIGETGLDKAIKTDSEIQTAVFLSHLTIAHTFRKPVIIHCVRSYSELLGLRKKSDLTLPWIFHWFNADEHIATELIRKNCYLSFGHMLFNENSKAFKVFKNLSPDSMFFETDDAGYTIRQIYERAAMLRKMTVVELKDQILNNFGRCFQL